MKTQAKQILMLLSVGVGFSSLVYILFLLPSIGEQPKCPGPLTTSCYLPQLLLVPAPFLAFFTLRFGFSLRKNLWSEYEASWLASSSKPQSK